MAGPLLPASLLLAPGPAPRRDTPETLHRAAQEFEALFLEQILKAGHLPGTEEEGILGGSNAESIYRSLRDAELARAAAARGGFGIAEMLERQWADRLQTVDGSAPTPRRGGTAATPPPSGAAVRPTEGARGDDHG